MDLRKKHRRLVILASFVGSGAWDYLHSEGKCFECGEKPTHSKVIEYGLDRTTTVAACETHAGSRSARLQEYTPEMLAAFKKYDCMPEETGP